MKPYQFGKKQKLLWGLFLLCAWGTVILLFSRHHGGFTAKELANYKPDNPLLSCLVMLGLFALKSVDFLMHSGVLYAAYHFLEDFCDIHWWSDYEEYVPQASSLTLDTLNETGKPDEAVASKVIGSLKINWLGMSAISMSWALPSGC